MSPNIDIKYTLECACLVPRIPKMNLKMKKITVR